MTHGPLPDSTLSFFSETYGISLRRGAPLGVDVFPVPNPDHQDNQPVILDLADDPEIPHPESPKFSEAGTLQGFSDGARILQSTDSLVKKRQYTPGLLRVELT
jgi:hypothetical protein